MWCASVCAQRNQQTRYATRDEHLAPWDMLRLSAQQQKKIQEPFPPRLQGASPGRYAIRSVLQNTADA
jgi:hypothetical protein